jgi:transposase InsO family protein
VPWFTRSAAQQLKCLTAIDEYTREALVIDVAGSIRSGRVIEVLAQLISIHGAPRALRSDNGPEFVSLANLRWLSTAGIDCVLSDPGKPWQNGTDGSFNGKLRDECSSIEWFRNRHEAAPMIETRRRHSQRGPAALEPRLLDPNRSGRARDDERSCGSRTLADRSHGADRRRSRSDRGTS